MSIEAMEIMREQRENQIVLNPGSETFLASGTDSFIGIFDRAHLEDNKDSGNVKQKSLNPVIMVSEIPAGLVPRETVITREEGDSYTLFFIGKNDEGVPLLWLF